MPVDIPSHIERIFNEGIVTNKISQEDVEEFRESCASLPKEEECLSRPLLYFAVKWKRFSIVQLLVEAGVAIQNNSAFCEERDLIIKTAVEVNDTDTTNYLLTKGANPNVSLHRWNREMLIERAVTNKNWEMVASLVAHSANIENALSHAKERANKKHHYENYSSFAQAVMDYAIGIDFCNPRPLSSGCASSRFSTYCGLTGFEHVNISDVNFLGVFVGGHRVIHDMLLELNLEGADQAIVNLSDLDALKDRDFPRYEALKARLIDAIKKPWEEINEEDINNLLPFWRAAELGNINAIHIKLAAGIDPNKKGGEAFGIGKKDFPLIYAAKAGHINIVRLLAEHPAIDRCTFAEAIEAANKAQKIEIAAYLESLQEDVNSVDEESEFSSMFFSFDKAKNKASTSGSSSSPS